MESRAKLMGHPIHPMLVVFPLALFVMALVCDIVYMVTGNAGFATVAYWDIAGGVVGGLTAALFGFWDWLAIPAGTRAKAIGLWHGGGNVVIVVLFIVSWLLRLGAPGHVPGAAAFILAIVGVGLALVTGWLGGELVDRLGIGVDPGAHADAPSSLSGIAADQEARPTVRPRGPAPG